MKREEGVRSQKSEVRSERTPVRRRATRAARRWQRQEITASQIFAQQFRASLHFLCDAAAPVRWLLATTNSGYCTPGKSVPMPGSPLAYLTDALQHMDDAYMLLAKARLHANC